jgi:hypothetical protein
MYLVLRNVTRTNPAHRVGISIYALIYITSGLQTHDNLCSGLATLSRPSRCFYGQDLFRASLNADRRFCLTCQRWSTGVLGGGSVKRSKRFVLVSQSI